MWLRTPFSLDLVPGCRVEGWVKEDGSQSNVESSVCQEHTQMVLRPTGPDEVAMGASVDGEMWLED